MITHPVLTALTRNDARLGLNRMRSFLAFLGDPLAKMPVVHVAGTNGKGSVIRVLARVLGEAGVRVGEFTSPHLQRVNERIRVADREINDDDLDALLNELDSARQSWLVELGGGEVHETSDLSFFEMLTAAGLVYFARQSVDVALVEVGLGGRLDATNLVEPLVSAIVTVSRDHEAQLGSDLASIASEKAGIIKPGRPVVVGRVPPDALKVIRLFASERDAEMYVADEDYRILHSESARFSWASANLSLLDLPLNLNGEHQIENASVALAILRVLRDAFPVTEAQIRAGLSTVQHIGRLEWVAEDVLLDSAHNGDGAATLSRFLGTLPRDRPRTLLLGVGQDKDVRAIVVQLAGQVDQVLTTHCSHRKASKAAEVAHELVGFDLPVLPAGPIEQALPLARNGGALVIVAGSVFIAGAARDIVEGTAAAS
ncbi:MAG: folylpolyglutamate synthase/dihydrofolate synthase family protein [Myxococcota bacterium]